MSIITQTFRNTCNMKKRFIWPFDPHVLRQMVAATSLDDNLKHFFFFIINNYVWYFTCCFAPNNLEFWQDVFQRWLLGSTGISD